MFAGVGDTENAGSISSMGQLLENTESGRDISEVSKTKYVPRH